MKVRLFTILAVLVGMLRATVVSAQNLPLLPQDPTIKSCVFSNGLSCYLTENASSRSVADFSLLRRDYEGDDLVCQHKDVIVSTEVVVDSLLLNLMRRVESDKRPADYAIVICGDIDAATVMKKLKYMSLMVDSSVPSPMPTFPATTHTRAPQEGSHSCRHFPGSENIAPMSRSCLSFPGLHWLR